MNILMLNYEFPPLGGGAANANKHVLEEMAGKDDLEVDLVTSSTSGYVENDFADNINVYRLNVSKDEIHEWTQLEVIRFMWKSFWKGRSLKKKNDYDLIHAWFGFTCGLVARLLRLPYILSLRGGDVPGFDQRFSNHYKFLKPLFKHVWRNAEKVTPNSQGLKQMAQDTLDVEMEVIPNGVDAEKFQPVEPRIEDLEGKLSLLCVSRLTCRKRIADIFLGVKDLNVELTVIGEGGQEKRLREKARRLGITDKVKFLGYVPHAELPEKYQEANIFILPSLNEGMSNTVLEAVSSGLPVITTRTGGTDELVKDNGTFVDKKSPSQIREAVKDYQRNPGKIKRQGEKSRKIAEEMSWKKVAMQYFDAYREII